MLFTICAGPTQIPAEFVDVYFQPLINELKDLWKGVSAIDGSISRNLNQKFTLHGALLCTEHDSQGMQLRAISKFEYRYIVGKV